jgi:hypothetical protein
MQRMQPSPQVWTLIVRFEEKGSNGWGYYQRGMHPGRCECGGIDPGEPAEFGERRSRGDCPSLCGGDGVACGGDCEAARGDDFDHNLGD